MATNGISNFLSAFYDLSSSGFQAAAPAVSRLASKVAGVVGKIPTALADGVSTVKDLARSKPNLVVIENKDSVLEQSEEGSLEAKEEREIDVSGEGEEKSLYVEVLASSAIIIRSKPI